MSQPLRLEIDTDRRPIAGRMLAAGQPARQFEGWLELVSLIEGQVPTTALSPERESEQPRASAGPRSARGGRARSIRTEEH